MVEKQRDIIEVEAEKYQLTGKLNEERDRLGRLLEEARKEKVHVLAGLEAIELSELTGAQNRRMSIARLLAEATGRLEKGDGKIELITSIVQSIEEVGKLEGQLTKVSVSPEPPQVENQE